MYLTEYDYPTLLDAATPSVHAVRGPFAHTSYPSSGDTDPKAASGTALCSTAAPTSADTGTVCNAVASASTPASPDSGRVE